MTPEPLRIFLVEDSPILRERLLEMLAAWENVEISGHAEAEGTAATALQHTPWDVLILDLQLLQGTGLGVLRELSTHRKPGTVVIVYTNYAIPLYRTRSMQLGADYFFDKAQEFGRIKDVLSDLVGKKTSHHNVVHH
jgi:DNA-binding NarL/FixJ family response regulator